MEMKRVARLSILYSKKEVQIRKVAITFLASGGKNKQGQHSALHRYRDGHCNKNSVFGASLS